MNKTLLIAIVGITIIGLSSTAYANQWSYVHPYQQYDQETNTVFTLDRCTTTWCMAYDTAHSLVHILEEMQIQTEKMEQSNCIAYYSIGKTDTKAVDAYCGLEYTR